MPELIEVEMGNRSSSTIERDRLVRFCYHLIGDASVAEDLAQETLICAWQQRQQLRDPDRRDAWLKAIARNRCRRWLRDQTSAQLHRPLPRASEWPEAGDLAEPTDDLDLEIELERSELADLLDRALGMLTPETRRLLIERYVEELPQAETARQHGLTEGAVAMRLQRGKLTFRNVLVTAFPEALADLGLLGQQDRERWRPTRIWCPHCGQQRLQGIFVRRLGVLRLRCPDCIPLNNTQNVALFDGVTGHRAALMRLLELVDWLYKYSWEQSTVPCPGCGKPLLLRKDRTAGESVLSYFCGRCHCGTWNGQGVNLLALPESRSFWRAHPRMRFLPSRQIEAAGRPAIVAGFEAVAGRSRLEIVYARDTLDVIAIHQNGTST